MSTKVLMVSSSAFGEGMGITLSIWFAFLQIENRTR